MDQPSVSISESALLSQLGQKAGKRVIRYARKEEKHVSIPDVDFLKAGDIILSRVKQNPDIVGAATEAFQRKDGVSVEGHTWTHAMIYVGNLHVVESTKSILSSGVRIECLPKAAYKKDMKICRYQNEQFDKTLRLDVARHALLMACIHRRGYDVQAAFRLLFNREKRRLNHQNYINCSELVLETFAIAAELMVQDYDNLKNGHITDFMPGRFFDDTRFDKFDMPYRRLIP